MAKDMQLHSITIEGDALQEILAFKGQQHAEDWRALPNILLGRSFLSTNLFWNLCFAPRCCNSSAHKLAKWAKDNDFCGQVDLDIIPPSVWSESNEP